MTSSASVGLLVATPSLAVAYTLDDAFKLPITWSDSLGVLVPAPMRPSTIRPRVGGAVCPYVVSVPIARPAAMATGFQYASPSVVSMLVHCVDDDCAKRVPGCMDISEVPLVNLATTVLAALAHCTWSLAEPELVPKHRFPLLKTSVLHAVNLLLVPSYTANPLETGVLSRVATA